MRRILLVLPILLLLQSCFPDSPSDYFNKSTLNTNIIADFGGKDFEQYISLKETNQLYAQLENEEWVPQDNLELHLTTMVIPGIEEDLEEVKDLRSTDDTEKMLEASINLYTFTLDKYRTDYIAIAKLIDANAPQEEIEAAIIAFDEENLDPFWNLHTKLVDIAIPYAEENGIEVSRY